VLRHLLDLREREIAEVLGIRRSSVSQSLAAAHRTLRGWLSDELDEERECLS
jgi:DNA-directed RNA polymerase specialized sigma24 family protein